MNNEIFNGQQHKELRKKLRTNPTVPESDLWSKLRGSQLCGCKFRRQQGIGNYIVDFYCPAIKLVVEVDGESHYEKGEQDKDRARDEYLQSLNLVVLRFTNREVAENINGVLEEIVNKITTLNPSLKRREE